MYSKIFKKSWTALKDNLILLVPDILLIFGFLIFTFLFLLIINTFSGFEDFSEITSAVNAEQIQQIILNFIRLNPLKLLLSLSIFLAVNIFYGVSTNILKFNMMKDIVNNKKVSIKNSFKEIKNIYWRFIAVNLLFIFITSIAAFIVIILAYFIRFPNFWKTINIAFLTLIGIIFTYKEAILFLEKKSSIQVIRHTFKFFIKKSNYVFITWLIVALIGIALLILFSLASLLNFSPFLILLAIATFILSIWSDLFFFYAYKLKN